MYSSESYVEKIVKIGMFGPSKDEDSSPSPIERGPN